MKIKEKLQSAWNWIKDKVKRVAIFLGIVSVATAGTVGMIDNAVVSKAEINDRVNTFEVDQESFKNSNGQYQHVPRHYDSIIKAWVEHNSYLKPDGNVGYWIVIENDETIEYFGYGVDANILTKKITKWNATSTKQ